MVTAVTTDPTLRLNSEKAAQSRAESGTERRDGDLPIKAKAPEGNRVEIDDARQLYRMENTRGAEDSERIKGPEQAREVLGRVLQQLADRPAQAMQAYQMGGTNQIARLLESAPA
jgi:hypothetical protein